MPSQRKRDMQQNRAAQEWNRNFPPGTPVTVKVGEKQQRDQTATIAQVMGGQAAVWLESSPFPIKLELVEAAEKERAAAEERQKQTDASKAKQQQ